MLDKPANYRATFGLDETSGACRSSEVRGQRKERRADRLSSFEKSLHRWMKVRNKMSWPCCQPEKAVATPQHNTDTCPLHRLAHHPFHHIVAGCNAHCLFRALCQCGVPKDVYKPRVPHNAISQGLQSTIITTREKRVDICRYHGLTRSSCKNV